MSDLAQAEVPAAPASVDEVESSSSPAASVAQVQEAQGRPSDTPSLPVEEFGAVLRRVEEASHAWSIHPDLAEGRFVSAMMAAIGWTGRVTQASQVEWQALFKLHRDAADLELARAREITKAVNSALGQARSALLGLQVERENVAVRMIHETMPLFIEKLKPELKSRQREMIEALRFRSLVVASCVGLTVFLGGYAVRAWADSDAVGALGNCLAHPVTAEGHLYCDVTSFRDARR